MTQKVHCFFLSSLHHLTYVKGNLKSKNSRAQVSTLKTEPTVKFSLYALRIKARTTNKFATNQANCKYYLFNLSKLTPIVQYTPLYCTNIGSPTYIPLTYCSFFKRLEKNGKLFFCRWCRSTQRLQAHNVWCIIFALLLWLFVKKASNLGITLQI